jgi:hypothetical protein
MLSNLLIIAILFTSSVFAYPEGPGDCFAGWNECPMGAFFFVLCQIHTLFVFHSELSDDGQ